MIMEELQFADSKYETLEALKDMIDNWLLDYRLSGGEEE